MTEYESFIARLASEFWRFVDDAFQDRRHYFDRPGPTSSRPPVFVRDKEEHNLLYPPDASEEIRQAILGSVPVGERHEYFGSMRSSQALAQSVFGSLVALKKIDLLASLKADDDSPAFFDEVADSRVELEYAVGHLGEPRPTSVDVWFEGQYRVAVECKFGEGEFGPCSRPNIKPNNHRYDRYHCDGTYSHQRERKARCSLTEVGVRYWDFVPELFKWAVDRDLTPCPLDGTYQLVRNVLAACVELDRSVNTETAHALVIYDERNPAFHPGGNAYTQWNAAVDGLRNNTRLRRCSWQRFVEHIRSDPELDWLVEGLRTKYGIEGS